jgi:hypothetical protein
MKLVRSALVALVGLAVLMPAAAEAGCRTRITRDRCGNILHWEYVFVGRDCHGCPRYDWVVVRRECPPPPCHPGGFNPGWNRGASWSGHPSWQGVPSWSGGSWRGGSWSGGSLGFRYGR